MDCIGSIHVMRIMGEYAISSTDGSAWPFVDILEHRLGQLGINPSLHVGVLQRIRWMHPLAL